jgi:hypothetical protein
MQFTDSEKKFIQKIEKWDNKLKKIKNIFYHILLILGGVLVISILIITFENINNPNIVWITLPGILIGGHFIWLYLMGKYWIKERSYIANILHKLKQDKELSLD